MSTINVGTLTFDIDDIGPRDAEAVLLLHGFPEDRLCWRELASGLQEAGYRTIAFDQRGYSPGARPRATSDYRLGELVGDALGVLDELGVPDAHVVGHDWGGAVAWALASVAPDRVRTLTVLSTPHPGAITKVAWRSTQLLKSWYMGMFQVPHAAEWLMAPGRPAWRALMRGLPPESVARYTDRASQPGALSAMLKWYRALPLDAVRPSVQWHRIRMPTLYVWGRRDPALGEAAALETERFVAAEYTFVALPGEGHWLPERASARILPLLLDHLRPATSA